MSEPFVVARQLCTLGESPIWSVSEQALYWVDIVKPMIYRREAASGQVNQWKVQDEIGSIGFAGEGRLIAATRRGFGFFKLGDGSFHLLADPEGNGVNNAVRMNDGKVDRLGRFWCGGMEDPGCRDIASLYRFDPDHTFHKMENAIAISNAICWNPNNTIMYFADSLKSVVWAYDFDAAEGIINNRRVFIKLNDGEGVPDGATVDVDGFLWLAHFGGGVVKRYDPKGKVERCIKFPVSQTTCPAFGGSDMSTLYVTTASINFSPNDFQREPFAGSLFVVETDIKGVPEPIFGA